MAKDDWEPENETQTKVSPEEQAAVAQMLESGMDVTEVVARARRDYATEQANKGGAGGGGAAGGAKVPDDEVLTAGEARRMMDRAQSEARMATQSDIARGRLDDTIGTIISANPAFAKVSAGTREAIKAKVGNVLAVNVKVGQMNQGQFSAAVAEATAEVLKEEQSEAALIAGSGDGAEAATRLQAQGETGEGNSVGGGSAKPSAEVQAGAGGVKTDPSGAPVWTDENPIFGVGVRFPTDAQATLEHQSELSAAYREIEAKGATG